MSTDTATGTLKASVGEAKLDPWPLAPEQVAEGDPQASGTILWKSTDSRLCNGIWECSPGTFDWVHAEETACLVAGRVTVTPEGEEAMEIATGDLVFFPEGTKTRWQVHETVRKAFHLRSSEPLPF